VPARAIKQHGQPEKETPTEDEQAQAPEALEGKSPQDAYVAEVIGALADPRGIPFRPVAFGRRVFSCGDPGRVKPCPISWLHVQESFRVLKKW